MKFVGSEIGGSRRCAVSSGQLLAFDSNDSGPRLTQVWAWPKSEPSPATLGPHLGQIGSRLGHRCRAPSPAKRWRVLLKVFGFSFLLYIWMREINYCWKLGFNL